MIEKRWDAAIKVTQLARDYYRDLLLSQYGPQKDSQRVGKTEKHDRAERESCRSIQSRLCFVNMDGARSKSYDIRRGHKRNGPSARRRHRCIHRAADIH